MSELSTMTWSFMKCTIDHVTNVFHFLFYSVFFFNLLPNQNLKETKKKKTAVSCFASLPSQPLYILQVLCQQCVSLCQEVHLSVLCVCVCVCVDHDYIPESRNQANLWQAMGRWSDPNISQCSLSIGSWASSAEPTALPRHVAAAKNNVCVLSEDFHSKTLNLSWYKCSLPSNKGFKSTRDASFVLNSVVSVVLLQQQ